ESPNLTPRALIGAFSGTTGPIGFVLTGPNNLDPHQSPGSIVDVIGDFGDHSLWSSQSVSK
ncbi:MAG: hypothetical protein KUF74_15965, partial [Candidatus Thiodiazotropha sp. (ex Ctena orbiculata)]|nr:hypothetical protein [Candidatus Thiodiazotropha taylori]